MANKKPAGQEHQHEIENIFYSKFRTAYKTVEFFSEVFYLIASYHKSRAEAMEVAFVIDMFIRDIVKPWSILKPGQMPRSGVGDTEGLPGKLTADSVNQAGIYILKAFANESNESSYSKEYQTKIISQVDMFFEVAAVIRKYNTKQSLLKS